MDSNTFYYFFSTMAQVLAAIMAVTAIFVFQKSDEYKKKMQREMSNVADLISNLGKPIPLPLIEWMSQAAKAERHGVVIEMRDIFSEFPNIIKDYCETNVAAKYKPLPRFHADLNEYCSRGVFNAKRHRSFLIQFTVLICCGFILILADMIGLMLTQTLTTSTWILPTFGGLMGVFLLAMALFVILTIRESRFNQPKG